MATFNLKKKKKKKLYLNDNSSKTTEAVFVKLGTNVAWVRAFQIMAICLLVWLPWQQKAPIDYHGKMDKLHFLNNW